MSESEGGPLLEVSGLTKHYPITEGLLRKEVGRVRALDGISLSVDAGETLGIVGESGSGKSTAALTMLRLVEPTDGTIYFDGDDITDQTGPALREYRRRAQLIVQDPNEAFSPRMTIGDAVEEPLMLHGMSDGERRQQIVEDILERVGLSADDTDRYPHEFSGGEKQRIAIARALVLNPDLIIADEPTSALDGRVQSDVLGLLDEIRQSFNIAVVFISHDINLVQRFCDDVAVMYLGEIVESGPADEIIANPTHPYTRVLVESIPSLDPDDRSLARPLTDTIPDPSDPPAGCRFHTRCPEIIQPADTDLDAAIWQALARFRFSVEAGELPTAVDTAITDGPASPQTVKESFDLPDTTGDETIDAVVDTAIEAVCQGDLEAASASLKRELVSPCEQQIPEQAATDGVTVSCHRYVADAPGTPNDPAH